MSLNTFKLKVHFLTSAKNFEIYKSRISRNIFMRKLNFENENRKLSGI